MASTFHSERFRTLVLYIAHRKRDDLRFGRTKLAKVLFYSDFNVYQSVGSSLTGANYFRMPFGPFPRELEETEEALQREGQVLLDYDKEVYEEKRMVPLKPPPNDLANVFEAWHLAVVDLWIDRVASATAREISKLSHDHPGWRLARRTGADIPYETALLPQDRPSGHEAEEAKEIAREQGWLSNEEWVWERSPS